MGENEWGETVDDMGGHQDCDAEESSESSNGSDYEVNDECGDDEGSRMESSPRDTEVADASLAAMLQHMQSTDQHNETSADHDKEEGYRAYGTGQQGGHESVRQRQRPQQRAEWAATRKNNNSKRSTGVRGADESCKTCKGARGICRRWNAPGHLYDFTASNSGSNYGHRGQSERGCMCISSLAAAAAASHSGSDNPEAG